MAYDEGPPPLHMDWTAQRVFLGRPMYVWQLNLSVLLTVLFVAFVGRIFPLSLSRPLRITLWKN